MFTIFPPTRSVCRMSEVLQLGTFFRFVVAANFRASGDSPCASERLLTAYEKSKINSQCCVSRARLHLHFSVAMLHAQVSVNEMQNKNNRGIPEQPV